MSDDEYLPYIKTQLVRNDKKNTCIIIDKRETDMYNLTPKWLSNKAKAYSLKGLTNSLRKTTLLNKISNKQINQMKMRDATIINLRIIALNNFKSILLKIQ